MSGKHRLFYSTRCRHCQAFLAELAKTPFAPEFILVSVDPSPSRPPLPPWLKSVPTMIPAGSSEPLVGPGAVNNWLFARKIGGGGGERKSGAAALDERNALIRPPEYSPDLAPRPHAAARSAAPPPTAAHLMSSSGGDAASAATSSSGKPDLLGVKAYEGTDANVLAYHGNEMSGSGKWSDSYSFLGAGGDTASDKMYNPIGRQFESLVGSPTVSGIGGAGAAGGSRSGGPKRSAKEEAEQNRLEAYMAARDSEIPGPPTRR